MVLRLSPQVLEDDLLHEALHQVPVFHNPMTDRPLFAQMFRQLKLCTEIKKTSAGVCVAIHDVFSATGVVFLLLMLHSGFLLRGQQ